LKRISLAKNEALFDRIN